MVVVRVQGPTWNISIAVSLQTVEIAAIIWVILFRVHGRKWSQPAQQLWKYLKVCFGVELRGRDDDCFITSGSDMWSCTYEVNVNSDLASQYKCDHVKHAKNPDISGPVATYLPNNSSYLCSNSVRANLIEVVSSLPPATPVVVQVSDQVFAVFVLPTSSNPLGFCHVKRGGRNKSGYCCTAKVKRLPFLFI